MSFGVFNQYTGYHNRKGVRLYGYDYSKNGVYFITICTYNHNRHFGEIGDGNMVLSEPGILAEKYWNEIPKQFPFSKLDAFVLMPNHIHGIVIIDNLRKRMDYKNVIPNCRDAIYRVPGKKRTNNDHFEDAINRVPGKKRTNNDHFEDAINRVPGKKRTNNDHFEDAINRVPTVKSDTGGGITGQDNPMLHPDSLSNIIRWYKGRTKFEINKTTSGKRFKWQPRFYDHIIGDEKSLHLIRQYIRNNPLQWELDSGNHSDVGLLERN